jgi:hypothetical protein
MHHGVIERYPSLGLKPSSLIHRSPGVIIVVTPLVHKYFELLVDGCSIGAELDETLPSSCFSSLRDELASDADAVTDEDTFWLTWLDCVGCNVIRCLFFRCLFKLETVPLKLNFK